MSNKDMVSPETENKGQRKVFVPNKLLDCLPRSSSLPNERLRWNTNEEIASYLISFDRHDEWLSCTLKTRPKNGSIILYNRKKVRYRNDGYCWKKRKDGKTTREDHMKLKVQGMECLYGCYVHSSIMPTFHRRCYWLLQNPDIVLVHYLNVPSPEDSGKCSPLLCAVCGRHDALRWSRDDLLSQLKPMFHSVKCSLGFRDFSIEELVQHILDRQRPRPQPRTHACLCSCPPASSGANIPHRCNSTKHRIISPKLPPCSPLSSEAGEAGREESRLPQLQAQSPGSSPSASSTSGSSSSPPPRSATIAVGNHGNGFYSDRHSNMAAVALPQNAVIVMATPEEAGQRRSFGSLLISPTLPAPAGKPASPSPPPAPVHTTLSLTLLPSPVIGGLLLTPSSSHTSASRQSPPPASPPSSPCPPPPPPSLPPAFDPDSFLNSPKQGQTYGGPPPSPTVVRTSPSLSHPSLALSLSPTTSTPPSSVSPPSSLSSLSTSPSSSSASPPSSGLPPPLSLSLSPTSSVAPPILPLCLELGALGESDGVREESRREEEEVKEQTDDDDDDEGRAPPTKLVLLQTSHAPSSASPRQHTDSSSASLLLGVQDGSTEPSQSSNHMQCQAEDQQPLVLQPTNHLPGAEAPPPAELSRRPVDLPPPSVSFAGSEPVAVDAGSLATAAVPERRRRRDSEETRMDTQSLEEAEPGERRGEDLDISFDSQFPDLISDLMTEEPGPAEAPPPAAMFPTAVRYVVPPQPSPSTSFLPFPHPLPASSTRLASITDFSPEWSYPEGGVKVLITGPWSEPSGRYSCVFDQSPVPASLIQPGVLRCYCPAHEAGLVCLQVLESGGSVSSSVLFEYRARNASSLPSSQLDWLSLDDNQFRMSILERLEQMERRMAEMAARDHHHCHHHHHHQLQQQQQHGNQLATPPPLPEDHQQSSQWFERRIVGVCERMMRGARWGGGGGGGGGGDRLHHSARHRGMTLLHLAAAQGYTHLIHTLIHWRTENADSLDLEQEVDPLNVDHFSCTPLMWACALGHQRAAELLYTWNGRALGIPDSLGRLPLAVARSRGHTRLAAALEELHTRRAQVNAGDASTPAADAPPPSPLSTSPDTGLSSSSSLPSPSDPASPSPSSAYSSGPAPMDTCPSSPSSLSSSSLPVSPPSPSFPLASLPAVSMWREEPDPAFSTGLSTGGSRDASLFLMDYENAPPTDARPDTVGGRLPHPAAALEEQLLSYSENAENEGEEEYLEEEVLQVDMATLAEQIIEATPERIKQEDFPSGAESPLRERRDNPAIQDTWLATYLETVDSHSPPRRVCPPSPLSALALQRLRPPSSAAWAEFLNASANGKMERDFALLTLTDGEQRELYEAARIIQNAFRRYKGRRLKEQQDVAAAVIQRCYRKYKQLTWIALKYALYKKMTQAAILIQSKFRSYYEQKRFQQSRRAAVLIQQYYRSYKEYERLKQAPRGGAAHNPKIKGTFLTKKQDQAARKIMRFLRRCRHRIKELKQSRELERRGLTT
ncbi:calmodulin-binding transcription activator 2 isoform X1 [Fundulus heteroclitus]|uniref:calmodulin-binding transcription activator 2 isoform X1 n=1 Tax=Fundulus heteroclitus TaxID=8078 RepID=UPI00165C6309|nr:calmodulin-binding transcription activator 2 isoform X1 [Fundulus heteroclitus]XP_035986955.1 calmodulin-binding transcription activator 2 isoform X1 [Fundulus heteroclitus]XP_035986956.1 calmodulin-binding transcription activator 2 isoform X1 [Fundulus heteroclitus]